MHAEIVSIGNEIVSGQLLDTNSQWLSQRLEELGVRVLYHSTVADDLERMTETFRAALRRSDVVISTGGIGPTPADMTREAVAAAAGRKLVLDPQSLEHIRRLFARRNRPMPERNERQAYQPEGGRAVHNPNGTAPGIDLEVPRGEAPPSRLFCLPGVPAEMKEMWQQTLEPAIRKLGGGRGLIRHRRLHCFGAGESHLVEKLADYIHKTENPRVGITASRTVITLRLAATGASDEACETILCPIAADIRQRLGTLVFGEDDDEMQHAVVRLLRTRQKTLATVEWGTAGLVAEWLGGVADSTDVYRGGIVAPGGAGLTLSLGLPADLVARPQEAGRELAIAMADACRAKFDADLGLAVGPFPSSQAEAAQPQPVYYALASRDSTAIKTVPYAGHPAHLKTYCGLHALDMLRLHLLSQP